MPKSEIGHPAREAAQRILDYWDIPAGRMSRAPHSQDEVLVARALLSSLKGSAGKGNTSAAGAPPILARDAVDAIVHLIVRDVAELPDRTSPEGREHMMLVAGDELEDIIRHALKDISK